MHVIISYTCGVLYVLTLAGYHISYILLLFSTAQKMKSSLMKTSSRREGPWSSACVVVLHLPVLWCFVLLRRHLGLVISFILRLDVINIGYTIYFTIYRFMCET
jgi:hypothetical protein